MDLFETFWKCAFGFLISLMVGPTPFTVPVLIAILFYGYDESLYWGTFYSRNHPYCWGVLCVSIFLWVNGISWLILDLYAPQSFKNAYLVQKSRKVTPALAKKVAVNVLQGQIAIVPLAFIYDLFVQKGYGLKLEKTLPSYFEATIQLICTIAFASAWFYYSHALFHTKKLYVYHKIHHEIKAPFALAATYCHPSENIFCNVMSFTMGCMIFRFHGFVQTIMAFAVILNTHMDHSGWNLPWYNFQNQPDFHDKHHELFHINLGTTGFFDWLHNTGEKQLR